LLLDVVRRHTARVQHLSETQRAELARRYSVAATDGSPRVYYRITDNWLELTVRFIAPTHGVRELKDAINRDLLRGLDELGIPIASATFEVTGLPPVKLEVDRQPGTR
jgi:hypothetical protein